MFTFSLSSAFATVSWTGEAESKVLTEAGDYASNGDLLYQNTDSSRTATGAEGITEAYRAQLLDEADNIEYAIEEGTTYNNVAYTFYAPEKAEALKLVAAYKEDIKAAKTAKAAATIKDEFNGTNGEMTKLVANGNKGAVLTAAITAVANTDVYVDLTRLVERYGADVAKEGNKGYFLPGYGVITAGDSGFVKSVTEESKTKYYFGDSKKKFDVEFIFEKGKAVAASKCAFVTEWFMDNDYRKASEIEAGATALAAELVPLTTSNINAIKDEQTVIQREIDKYADKYNEKHAKNTLTIADLEAVDALIVKINDYNDKYAPLMSDENLKVALDEEGLVTALAESSGLAEKYFDQYCAEVSAIPEVKKLADTDKAKVLELYNKINALEDTYANVWKYVEKKTAKKCPESFACNYEEKLIPAYEDFLKKDVKAFKNLSGFTVAVEGTKGYYFDASEKNVNALKAQRTAYDALVADYGYYDLNDVKVGGLSYEDAAKAEAKILAAEHNMPADAAYDVKDNSKLQAYLNNGTVKVTTKALGNKKIRVQAQIDSASFEQIVDQMEEGSTITYQFYYKKASADTYKAGKVKDVNYSTFTLAKGVKYNFRCKVVIKDPLNNVVATKDYKASTLGVRTVR